MSPETALQKQADHPRRDAVLSGEARQGRDLMLRHLGTRMALELADNLADRIEAKDPAGAALLRAFRRDAHAELVKWHPCLKPPAKDAQRVSTPAKPIRRPEIRLQPEPSTAVLQPYDAREAMTVAAAAKVAGYSEAHMRRLVGRYELGRHIGLGMWKVSRVALRLFLDGDSAGLRAYHEGRRDHPSVAREFARLSMARSESACSASPP